MADPLGHHPCCGAPRGGSHTSGCQKYTWASEPSDGPPPVLTFVNGGSVLFTGDVNTALEGREVPIAWGPGAEELSRAQMDTTPRYSEEFVNALAGELDLSPAAVRAALDNLIARGLIQPAPEDT